MTDYSFITRHAETPCPNCQYALNASGDPATGAVPKAGDLCVCMNCAAILRYEDAALHLRSMTPDEIEALSAEERDDLSEKVAMVLAINSLMKKLR